MPAIIGPADAISQYKPVRPAYAILLTDRAAAGPAVAILPTVTTYNN